MKQVNTLTKSDVSTIGKLLAAATKLAEAAGIIENGVSRRRRAAPKPVVRRRRRKAAAETEETAPTRPQPRAAARPAPAAPIRRTTEQVFDDPDE